MNKGLDFHLDALQPTDPDSQYAAQRMWPGDLTVLAEHHTPDGSSYVVAHDRSVTWGVPGAPQIAAIKVTRDLSRNTFTFESTYHATVAFAQNWLAERGCPPERISRVGDGFMKPADDLTARVEEQIRTSDARYEVLDSSTSDYDPRETWILALDSDAVQAPVRLFLEEADLGTHTYTMREGAFCDEDAARQWLDDRGGPLPQPPEHREATVLRTRAALTRSAGVSAMPKANSPDAHSAPSAATAQHPSSGRSL